MSYDYNEDSNIMSAFFKGKIKVQSPESKYERVEIGHGVGIGHSDGSFSQYTKQLSEMSKTGNGNVYLGKAINEDKDVMSIVEETEKFNVGNVPKLLVMFHTLINQMSLKVEWKDENNETVLEQRYQIPLPYSMNYTWWDKYYTYFIGPEDLEEGDYTVEISSKEITTSGRAKELSSTIEFSVVG